MQCGVCSGSCPIGIAMDHGPRKLFMMIRAGMKDEVLASNTLWNCTSAIVASSAVRGSAGYQHPAGLAGKPPTGRCARACRRRPASPAPSGCRLKRFGRTDERLVTTRYYFSFGLKQGLDVC